MRFVEFLVGGKRSRSKGETTIGLQSVSLLSNNDTVCFIAEKLEQYGTYDGHGKSPSWSSQKTIVS